MWKCHTFRAGHESGGGLTLEVKLADSLRRESNLDVIRLAPPDYARFDIFPTLLQAGIDVHGSHGLFYWLRARGAGILIRNDRAATVLAWRPDFGSLVVLRPVGEPDAIAELFCAVGKVVSNTWPGISLVARYCTDAVTDRLVDRGWISPPSPLLSDALLDDEAYPEVIITADPLEMPTGKRGNLVRKAIHLNTDSYSYCTSSAPIGCGEAEFILVQAARAGHYDSQERSFNEALLTALHFHHHHAITYHYLFCGDHLSGFAITANTAGISHVYYVGTTKTSRLSAYFQWKIYLEERRKGALALNLGGSETEPLHTFKVRTFPKHDLRQTTILATPC